MKVKLEINVIFIFRSTAQLEIKYNKTDQSGRQTQIILGNNVQSLDFEYDLHGRLKNINNIDNFDEDGSFYDDRFVMRLYHDEGYFDTPYYNGMISSYDIKYPNSPYESSFKHHRYTFTYDKALRLKSACYSDEANWDASDRYKVNNLNYDANGNILSLKRYDPDGALMHDFDYNYASKTNKLLNTDGGGNDYTYYPNGNLQKDVSKDVTVYYNYLNLPTTLSKPLDSGGTMKVTTRYDDQAQRIYKASEEDGSITYYIRGIDGQLMGEYDGNEDLLCWRIGTFGHKTKDGSTISSYYYFPRRGGFAKGSFRKYPGNC